MNLSREPGAKAQLAAALVAIVAYVAQKYLHLLPEEIDLLAPVIAYTASQVAGWLWSRRLTTPVASPALPEGKSVTLPDGTAGKVAKA